jgi:adenylosuccinate lyase
MQSFADRRDFKALLLADPDVTRVLDPAGIERAFDLDQQFRHVDHVFDRVFQDASVRV